MLDETDSPQMVFVIMPFSPSTHLRGEATIEISTGQWTHIYEHWIKRAIESYSEHKLFAKRSPAIPGNFVRGIIQDLAEAPLVIADLTGAKTNVYYELGIRHALRTGCIIITQDISSLPSDLRSYYTFEYTYSDKAHDYDELFRSFEIALHEKFDAIASGHVLSDSPVSDFLGFRAHIIQKTAREEKSELLSIVTTLKTVFDENFSVCRHVYSCALDQKPLEASDWLIIDTFPLESLFTRLVNSEWRIMPRGTIDALIDIIRVERKNLLAMKEAWDVFRFRPDDESGELLHMHLENTVNHRIQQFDEHWKNVVAACEDIGLTFVAGDEVKATIPIQG